MTTAQTHGVSTASMTQRTALMTATATATTTEKRKMMANRTKKEITEHGMSMYRYRQCRCDICCGVMREFRKKYRKNVGSYNKLMDATPLLEWLKRNNQIRQIDDSTARKWGQRGITVYTIDKVCIRLGVHPAEVYGHKFYEGCFDEPVD